MSPRKMLARIANMRARMSVVGFLEEVRCRIWGLLGWELPVEEAPDQAVLDEVQAVLSEQRKIEARLNALVREARFLQRKE